MLEGTNLYFDTRSSEMAALSDSAFHGLPPK